MPEEELPPLGDCLFLIGASVSDRELLAEKGRHDFPEPVLRVHVEESRLAAFRGRHRAENQDSALRVPDGRDSVRDSHYFAHRSILPFLPFSVGAIGENVRFLRNFFLFSENPHIIEPSQKAPSEEDG